MPGNVTVKVYDSLCAFSVKMSVLRYILPDLEKRGKINIRQLLTQKKKKKKKIDKTTILFWFVINSEAKTGLDNLTNIQPSDTCTWISSCLCQRVATIRIFNICAVLIENSATGVTVRHRKACRKMPNSYPSDGIFNLHRRTIMDSFSSILFLRQLHLNLNLCCFINLR